jgi:hypothetical protein
MTHSRRTETKALRAERDALRREVRRLRAENTRLRDALVREVVTEVQGNRQHEHTEACVPRGGC